MSRFAGYADSCFKHSFDFVLCAVLSLLLFEFLPASWLPFLASFGVDLGLYRFSALCFAFLSVVLSFYGLYFERLAASESAGG